MTVKNPTGQMKKVRYLFLLPFIAIFALHLLLSPPNTYGGTRTPTRYDADDAQAVYPVPPLQTQKQAGPSPPQLAYVAALPVTALLCLFLLHTDRSQRGGTNSLLQHATPKHFGQQPT